MKNFLEMKRQVLAAAIGVLALGSSMAAPVQWTVASGGNDHWYEFVATNLTWDDARAAALASTYLGASGYLATALDAAENTFISVTVAGGELAWLGGTDAGSEANWYWADGPEANQALTYFNWNSGEPNNCCGGENYLQTNFGNNSGGWNDHGGPGNAGQANGYLVEYSMTNNVPEPTTLALLFPALLAAAVVRRRRG